MDTTTAGKEFFHWLDRVLAQPLPDRITAFHFNLYEAEDSVHIQLTGSDSFDAGADPATDYWPGRETFTTGEEVFELPNAVAGGQCSTGMH